MNDFSTLRNTASKLVKTPYQQGWQWMVEFSDTPIPAPADFDIYCKSVEHGGLTIEYEGKQIGANTINSPLNKTAGDVTLQIRDHEDGRCEKFFRQLAALVLNQDGTVNLPQHYLFKLKLYRFMADGSKVLDKTWTVSAGEYGGFTRGRDALGEFVSYPMVFKKYQALGGNK